MWCRVLERVKHGLSIYGSAGVGTSGVEMRLAQNFLDGLHEEAGEGKESIGLEILVEDALVLWLVSNRLMDELGELGKEKRKGPNKGKGVPVVKDGKLSRGLEEWFRKRDQLRKVRRELLSKYGVEDLGGDSVCEMSLAEMMAPILKLGEGVLEDVLEFGNEESRVGAAGGEGSD